MTDSILYEQPFNELTRVCLRLEFLHQQIHHHLDADDAWNNRASLRYLIELIQVLDRPDLKNKLTKEFMRLKESFDRLSEQKGIDLNKLDGIRNSIAEQLAYLESFHGKIAANLRDNEFLSSIRAGLAKPAGTSQFDLPLYHFWLQQKAGLRKKYLQQWIGEFDAIYQTIELLLHIIRGSARSNNVIAQDGFYQTLLNAKLPYQLVRVQVNQQAHVFPEVSVGRHRLSVRFLNADIEQRPQQAKKDIRFSLTCCAL